MTLKKSPIELEPSTHQPCRHTHGIGYDEALQQLKQAGHKLTKARLSLLKTLYRQPSPFTTEEIFLSVKQASKSTKIDLVTVYRSLTTFEEVGLLTRIDLGDGRVRYEATDASGAHHHHFICRACGKIEPLHDCEIRQQEKALSQSGYSQLSHRLEFFGLCPDCSQSDARTDTRRTERSKKFQKTTKSTTRRR